MKKFTWQEMRKYWEIHSSLWANQDYNSDPDGLTNVCYPGAPLWLNQYYARFQKEVYKKLFSLLPPADKAHALDIGCGAARWCRFLTEHGYQTVGIDLQRELIEINRSRYPDCNFVCTSIQDYHPKKPFDLISSVTVIQHIPFEEQNIVIQKLRDLIKDNGFAIVLENIHDQGPHVFSNTIKEWQKKFHDAGFSTIAVQRYDYSPFLRIDAWISQQLVRMGGRSNSNSPGSFVTSSTLKSGPRYYLRNANQIIQRLAVGFDSLLEPVLVRVNIGLPTIHCGFLFKAV